MKKLHFYKAKSRIGLTNKPINQSEFNFGVEEGPDFILETSFLRNVPAYEIDSFSFSKPENVKQDQFYSTLSSEIKQFKKLVQDSFKNGEIQVVVGGDHSITLPSILAAIAGNNGKSTGIIYFDSHADINLAKNSPTGNFHGMHMRPLFDKFDIPVIENLIKSKLPTTNLLYVGNLDLDAEEKEFLNKNKIRNMTETELKTNLSLTLEELKIFINKLDLLYVSFDIDCMDQSEAPATGIPAFNGLHIKEILPILELIKKHPNFSFDLVEVNPKKKGAGKTIKLAQQILTVVLS